MKLLLDVHIGTRIATALASAQHDVRRVADIERTASDLQILKWAREEGRIIVTEDSNFSQLVFALGQQAPLGIVYLRCPPLNQAEYAPIIVELLEASPPKRELVVIEHDAIRRRKFP